MFPLLFVFSFLLCLRSILDRLQLNYKVNYRRPPPFLSPHSRIIFTASFELKHPIFRSRLSSPERVKFPSKFYTGFIPRRAESIVEFLDPYSPTISRIILLLPFNQTKASIEFKKKKRKNGSFAPDIHLQFTERRIGEKKATIDPLEFGLAIRSTKGY